MESSPAFKKLPLPVRFNGCYIAFAAFIINALMGELLDVGLGLWFVIACAGFGIGSFYQMIHEMMTRDIERELSRSIALKKISNDA